MPGGGRVHQAGRLSRLPLLELALHDLHLEPGQVLPGDRVIQRGTGELPGVTKASW